MMEQAEGKIDKNVIKEHQNWIEFPNVRAEILRKKAEEAGEDADAILLGHILATIIGDDSNCFFSAKLGGYSPRDIEYSQAGILGRLSLEIKFKETPKILKKQLEMTREKLQEHDWRGEKGLTKALEIWTDNVEKWTEKYRDTNPEAKEAYNKFILFELSLAKKSY
jgi:hypothetical protein